LQHRREKILEYERYELDIQEKQLQLESLEERLAIQEQQQLLDFSSLELELKQKELNFTKEKYQLEINAERLSFQEWVVEQKQKLWRREIQQKEHDFDYKHQLKELEYHEKDLQQYGKEQSIRLQYEENLLIEKMLNIVAREKRAELGEIKLNIKDLFADSLREKKEYELLKYLDNYWAKGLQKVFDNQYKPDYNKLLGDARKTFLATYDSYQEELYEAKYEDNISQRYYLGE